MDSELSEKLSEKQLAVLEYVREFIPKTGDPPSLGDIAQHFKFSRNNASQYLQALCEKGYLQKTQKGKYRPANNRRARIRRVNAPGLPRHLLPEAGRERMAFEAHKFLQHRIRSYSGKGPVPIESADLSDVGYKWQAGGGLEQGVSGELDPYKRLIIINPVEYRERRRFTLAHEYGHLVQLSYLKGSRVFACQGFETLDFELFGEGGDEYIELEANWFAASLLLPVGPLIQFLNHSIEAFPSKEQLIKEVSFAFDVSLTVARYRLEDLYLALISPGYLAEKTF